MNTSSILPRLPVGEVFNKETFRKIVRSLFPVCSEASINWLLVSMRRQGVLNSVGAGKYYVAPKDAPVRKKYVYPHSADYLKLEREIGESYPRVNFQMWELTQMNDFVNHTISKNVIFVEVESMLLDTVYDSLRLTYPYAMLHPDVDAFFRLRAPETDVVVQKLLTEAPSPNDERSCPIEKILVDLFSKKLSGNLIERSEYPRIYEDCFKKYNVNETRMFRYAKRRSLYDEIVSFITTNANIRLTTI